MATEIQWTDETWNPVTGCTKVSPGCAHCYAEGVADRFWGKQYPPITLPTGDPSDPLNVRRRQFTDVMMHGARLDQPLHWKKPRRIFVNSMSDLFHEDVSDEFIVEAFGIMRAAYWHTFQVLTKRAERMRKFVKWIYEVDDGFSLLRNVWLGVSVENQHFADERIPLLLDTPAAVRFLSCEPLLEGLDLAKHRPGALGLHWCIVGGESGGGARPCEAWWIRNIVGQCRDADVPVFVKQLGAHVVDRNDAGFEGDTPNSWPMDTDSLEEIANRYQGDPVRILLNDRKGGDMSEWPEDLRVREFPAVCGCGANPELLSG